MSTAINAKQAAAGRLVTILVTGLGFGYIIDAILYWQTANLANFVLYAVTGIAAALFIRRRAHGPTSFSVNFFLVPLGIVELTLPETILLAILGTAICAWSWKATLRRNSGRGSRRRATSSSTDPP